MSPAVLPGPTGGYLDASHRERVLAGLASTRYDVVVVGGGVTGAGTALDAASRGLRTLLVERDDLANGTSRWSSKLVHGGVRYLAHGQVGVAWESARERHALLTAIAPHLVHPVAFLVPLDPATPPVLGGVVAAGLRVADVLRRPARTPTDLLPAPTRI
ncbi:FAD-dependent oxidoreductase, partial [Angustibacter speluncae]